MRNWRGQLKEKRQFDNHQKLITYRNELSQLKQLMSMYQHTDQLGIESCTT